jgi:F-type H+-transporting ATPase subunit b
MVDINWTVLIQIANFLFLLFVLNIVLYKPIRSIIGQRKAKVQGLEHNISTAGRSIEEKDKAIAESLKEARLEGQNKKAAILLAAQNEEKAIIDRINAKAQEDMATVKAKIIADTDKVRRALEKEVHSFADAITDKILGRAAR